VKEGLKDEKRTTEEKKQKKQRGQVIHSIYLEGNGAEVRKGRK